MHLHVTQRTKTATQKPVRVVIATDADELIAEATAENVQDATALAIKLATKQLETLAEEALKNKLIAAAL